MNRRDARKIAEIVTNKQLQNMFECAKNTITDWTKVSSVNKSLTKGAAWNILAKGFDLKHRYCILAKTNMVWEFGDYLPDEFKLPKKQAKSFVEPMHEDPVFDDE